MFDLKKIRSDFPILSKKRNNKNFVYFDNAATTQKPKVVIDSISDFYCNYNGNIQRGIHFLGEEATSRLEGARHIVSGFLHAPSSEEIIFNSSATHSINLVAFGFLSKLLKRGDQILIGKMEHHANIVPWQIVASKMGAKIIPINNCGNGEVDIKDFKEKINRKVKFVAIQHISNITGCKNNIKKITSIAHQNKAFVLVDGAQAVSHTPVNVSDLDCDFYCFSGHKCFGPTGVGVLFGKKSLLLKMDPYMGGGGMISQVSMAKSSWNVLPYKFEAGTPNIAGIIGLGAAIKYILSLGFANILEAERALSKKMTNTLRSIPGVQIFGGETPTSPVFSFKIKSIHNYDVGVLLDEMNICVRTGHLCAQPATKFFGTDGFVRASLCFYNTENEIRHFEDSLRKLIKMF